MKYQLRSSVSGMTMDGIKELDDDDITNAVMYPSDSRLAIKIFNLMMDTVDSCYIVAGMAGSVIAIDQDKMERMADRRGIDLVRYHKHVKHFISAMLEKMNKKDK